MTEQAVKRTQLPDPLGAVASSKRSSGDYTTTSTTFVDVDSTNLALTITTRAAPVMIGVVAVGSNSGINSYVILDVLVDGVRLGGTLGLIAQRKATANHEGNLSFTYLTDSLSAGAHTFKLQWRTAANTATLFASSSNPLEFWVEECP